MEQLALDSRRRRQGKQKKRKSTIRQWRCLHSTECNAKCVMENIQLKETNNPATFHLQAHRRRLALSHPSLHIFLQLITSTVLNKVFFFFLLLMHSTSRWQKKIPQRQLNESGSQESSFFRFSSASNFFNWKQTLCRLLWNLKPSWVLRVVWLKVRTAKIVAERLNHRRL